MSTQYNQGRQRGRQDIAIRLLDSLGEVLNVTTDSELADWIGVKQASISQWRSGTAAPQQNGLRKMARCLLSAWVDPLAETEPILPAKHKAGWRVHVDQQLRSGLRQRLEDRSGVYLFYDSLGRVTYVGRAKKNLFFELEQQLGQKPRHKIFMGGPRAAKLQAKQLLQGNIARFLSA